MYIYTKHNTYIVEEQFVQFLFKKWKKRKLHLHLQLFYFVSYFVRSLLVCF